MKTRSRLVVGPMVFGLALVMTACGASKSSMTTTSSTVATTSSTVATSLTTPDTAVTPTSVAATSTMSHLTAVQVSAPGAGDQISFEFDNGVPGYAVKTTQSPVPSSDGNVNVTGTSVYLVTFSTASDVDLSGGLKNYYNGSKDITPTNAKLVSEIKQISDDEGVLTWAIGVNTKATLNVSTVASPAQVVFSFS